MLNARIKDIAIVFMVTDLARSLRFYKEKLGLTFEVDDVEAGFLQAKLPGDVNFMFFAGEATVGATPQVVFGLKDGGIDAVAAALSAAGIEIVTAVSEAPGGWTCDFKDPDGHLLSLYQEGNQPR
ncbi:MAG TPA: VOC family protein [Myxococcota bacterium]